MITASPSCPYQVDAALHFRHLVSLCPWASPILCLTSWVSPGPCHLHRLARRSCLVFHHMCPFHQRLHRRQVHSQGSHLYQTRPNRDYNPLSRLLRTLWVVLADMFHSCGGPMSAKSNSCSGPPDFAKDLRRINSPEWQ